MSTPVATTVAVPAAEHAFDAAVPRDALSARAVWVLRMTAQQWGMYPR